MATIQNLKEQYEALNALDGTFGMESEGTGPDACDRQRDSSKSWPHGKADPVGPAAARSHSVSVGRRPCAQRA